MTWISIGGVFHPEDAPLLTVQDRAFRFGDGIFETILVDKKRPLAFGRYLKRLRRGLAFFRIPLALDDSLVRTQAAELIERNGLASGYLRLTVSRGTGQANALGYRPSHCTPYLLMQTVEKPFPAFSETSLWLSSFRMSFAAPCKTNSALPYVLALLDAEEQGCGNALLLSPEGYLCETASGNLFWIEGETLYTPGSDLPLIPGIMREIILELWEGEVKEGRFLPSALETAEEVFMSGTGGVMISVRAIEPLRLQWRKHQKTSPLRQKLIDFLLH